MKYKSGKIQKSSNLETFKRGDSYIVRTVTQGSKIHGLKKLEAVFLDCREWNFLGIRCPVVKWPVCRVGWVRGTGSFLDQE